MSQIISVLRLAIYSCKPVNYRMQDELWKEFRLISKHNLKFQLPTNSNLQFENSKFAMSSAIHVMKVSNVRTGSETFGIKLPVNYFSYIYMKNIWWLNVIKYHLT